ncbi:hypothetical protein [Nocardiopsis sp. MG754419]|uniref:hypothetical protein n=1 Tax=Nocardiopsis sp. MG754419 TaxID=2259865 RepID=UPI001BA64B59|nr:hypothetical protein [Nocardiopsis sp. MG754419]MBR8740599.1 hypothetical protein [Nocardiopsis sp. MG754419]
MEVHTQAPVRTPVPSFLGGAAVLAAALVLVALLWNAQTPAPVAHRIFLVLWLTGASVLTARLWGDGRSTRGASRSLVTFAIGLVTAGAVTTMPWSELDSTLWYQVWLSIPLLTGLALAAFRPTPRRRKEDAPPL